MHNNNHYAKTVFDLSQKTGCITKVQNQLISIKYLFTKVPAFRLVLITKRLDAKSKAEIINNTLTIFDALILEFLSILIYSISISNWIYIAVAYSFSLIVISIINIIILTYKFNLSFRDFISISNYKIKSIISSLI